MKRTLAVAAGASLALTTPAGAAVMLFAGSVPRSGIERVQAGPGTGGLRSKDQRNPKALPGQPQRRDRQRPDDNEGERSNNAPANPPDPPTCVFRNGPLDLII
jgi:hypothetical protein